MIKRLKELLSSSLISKSCYGRRNQGYQVSDSLIGAESFTSVQ